MAELFVTSSAAGKMGSPFSAAYAGTKHALHGYLETLRDELSCAESNIKITIGCPGPVRSNLRLNALTEKVHFSKLIFNLGGKLFSDIIN